MTATVGGGARGGGGDYGLIGEETVEKPRRGKIKLTEGSKTGGGGGTWEPIPSRELDNTLLCGAANGDRVQVKSMFALVSGPPPLCASGQHFEYFHGTGEEQRGKSKLPLKSTLVYYIFH